MECDQYLDLSKLTPIEGGNKYCGDIYIDKCATDLSLLEKYEIIEVTGNFDCSDCDSLTSLKSAPREVRGWFDCSGCYELVTLKGAPQVIGGSFDCSYCKSLTSLEYALKNIGGKITLTCCENIK